MKVIITGATGMVGKSVLLECLEDSSITDILLISRSSVALSNSKISELLISDFEEIPKYQQELKDYDACYHCMGISAGGKSKDLYKLVTYDYTKILADTLYEVSPNAVFIYVSGIGTDGSEKGRSTWARVKGRTENYILNKGFADAYAYRPGMIIPKKGEKSKTLVYNIMYTILQPFYGLLLRSDKTVTSTSLGRSMIILTKKSIDEKIISPSIINSLVK